MVQHFLSSDETPHQYSQSFPGGFAVQGVRQPSLSLSPTIDPRLLTFEGTQPPFQHNDPSIPLSITTGGYFPHQSPVPSTSTSFGLWPDYQNDELSPSVSTPMSPTVDNVLIFMDTCICGCGGGPCITQREYYRQRTDSTTEDELKEMILFRVKGKCGYPLKNALRKLYTNLDGRDDKVFVGFKSSISIRLEWLPYEKWTRQIRTLTWKKPADNISRAKLSHEVAKRMKIFFEEMQAKAADPRYQQYWAQPGVVDIDHLELVALKRVAKSSYMPHFRLITPPPQPQQLAL